MGETNGSRGIWAYAKGGMGAVSASIAAAARDLGVDIFTDAPVKKIVVDQANDSIAVAKGIELEDGSFVAASTGIRHAESHVSSTKFSQMPLLR